MKVKTVEPSMTFDDFWSRYPRKVAKLEAVKAWKQVTREYSPNEIVAGLDRNLSALLRKDTQYVKHPASWLRAGCWMDEPEPVGPRSHIDAARDFHGSASIFGRVGNA